MAPVPKLHDYQTFRHHESCGQHSVALKDSTVKYKDVPTLSLVHGFIKVVNALDVSTTTLGLGTVMACTGECAVQPVPVPHAQQSDGFKYFCISMLVALQLSAQAHDSGTPTVRIKGLIEETEATCMNTGMPTLMSIKDGLTALKSKLEQLE